MMHPLLFISLKKHILLHQPIHAGASAYEAGCISR